MSVSVSSTRLSGSLSSRSCWERTDTTERSVGGGSPDTERLEGEEKTRELEQILPLRLLKQSI